MSKPAKPPLPPMAPRKSVTPAAKHAPNPRLQADQRWQRCQRFTWDKNRGRG